MTAARLLIDRLVDGWGVRHIFGLSGDAITGLQAAIRERPELTFVSVRHEEAAAFAAVGYAKMSGRLGVCLATAGPGAIHLLNGLYDAKLDRVPVLAITGTQAHDLLGTFYQQDVDSDTLFADVAEHSVAITGPAQVRAALDATIRLALAGPGVGHVSIASDTQQLPVDSDSPSHMSQPGHTSSAWTQPLVVPLPEDLERAAGILAKGRRVAILAGAGARGASAELEAIADRLGAPIAKALLGKDVVPDDSPFTTGGIGVLGTSATADVMEAADTLLIVGSSFPYVAYYPPVGQARAIQIDTDAARIGLRHPVEVALVGDARATLQALLAQLEPQPDRSFLDRAQAGMGAWRELRDRQADIGRDGLKPQAVLRALDRRLPEEAIVLADSGANTLWAARMLDLRAGMRFTTSGLLASMGCALPYAVGAGFARPGRPLIAVVGDGGLSMLPGELATCVKERLPLKLLVLRDDALGFIRWEQMLYAGVPETAIELQPIDLVRLAESFGWRAWRTADRAGLEDAVDAWLAADGPALLEAVIDPLEPAISASLQPEQAKNLATALVAGGEGSAALVDALLDFTEVDSPRNRRLIREAFAAAGLPTERVATPSR
jgi:thiamine pyrophosphate-dependent acetolactate synthase large subunit-like protein